MTAAGAPFRPVPIRTVPIRAVPIRALRVRGARLVAATCLAVFTPGAADSATTTASRLPPIPSRERIVVPAAPFSGGDAEPAIAAARARALAGGKRLLIDLGANWCLNCRLLSGIMRDPQVAAYLARRFEIVTVDIGRFDRNMAVPLRLGFRGRQMFVPAIVVIDPRSRRIVNRGREMLVANTAAMTPRAVVATLAGWAG